MPWRKWSIQYPVLLLVLFVVLAGVQYLKGRDSLYAIEFGMLWSFITTTIFFVTRIRNYRNGVDCKVCNDLPEK